MSKPFKEFNTLGKPLCMSCGCNPRKAGQTRCGRCVRENRPIQWDRIPERDTPMPVVPSITPIPIHFDMKEPDVALTIYKYMLPITDIAEVEMPASARVLSVGEQDGTLFLWAEVDIKAIDPRRHTADPVNIRRFRVAGTGHELDRIGFVRGRFIGTVRMNLRNGIGVWHIYEEGTWVGK